MIRPDGLRSDCFIISYLSFQCGTLVVDLKGVIMVFGCVSSIQSFHRLESGIMMEDFVCCFEVLAVVPLFLSFRSVRDQEVPCFEHLDA
jgi:hypothetical protein